MYKVKSTYKVLTDRCLQLGSAEEWVDWALEMMEAGFETEHLIILAGLSPHLNRFEFDDIVNRALKELSLDTVREDEVVYGYVCYLIDEVQNKRMSAKVVLQILRELYRKRDYDKELLPFYLLAYAQEELEELGVQFYWSDANRSNIDSIIGEEFQKWKAKYNGLM